MYKRQQHESRQIFAQQIDKPKILHDGGIRTRFIQEAPVRERRRKLLVKQERVQRNVYRNAAGMAIFYRPKKLFIAEIACKATRIECAAPKVYSICTVLSVSYTHLRIVARSAPMIVKTTAVTM